MDKIKLEFPLFNNAKSKKKVLVATWDNNDEESSNEEQAREISNLALITIWGERFDELDNVNELPSYVELFNSFQELNGDLKKIG